MSDVYIYTVTGHYVTEPKIQNDYKIINGELYWQNLKKPLMNVFKVESLFISVDFDEHDSFYTVIGFKNEIDKSLAALNVILDDTDYCELEYVKAACLVSKIL